MNRQFMVLVLVVVMGLIAYNAGQTSGQPAATPGGEAVAGSRPVAVLDLVRIFNECAQIKDLNEMIRQRTEELTKEAGQRKEVIQNKQEELSAFQPGKSDYEGRRKDLMRLNVEANVWFKMQEDELEREKFDWTRIVYEQSLAVASELAKEQGIQMVMQRVDFKPYDIEPTVQSLRRMIQDRIVLYHVPEIDITDQVIRRLDVQYNDRGGKKQLSSPVSATKPSAAPKVPKP